MTLQGKIRATLVDEGGIQLMNFAEPGRILRTGSDEIRHRQNPTVLGLDPKLDYVPPHLVQQVAGSWFAPWKLRRNRCCGSIPPDRCGGGYCAGREAPAGYCLRCMVRPACCAPLPKPAGMPREKAWW